MENASLPLVEVAHQMRRVDSGHPCACVTTRPQLPGGREALRQRKPHDQYVWRPVAAGARIITQQLSPAARPWENRLPPRVLAFDIRHCRTSHRVSRRIATDAIRMLCLARNAADERILHDNCSAPPKINIEVHAYSAAAFERSRMNMDPHPYWTAVMSYNH